MILLINSIPKSVTYLVARFLTEIGATDSGLHFRSEALWNFKRKPLADIIKDPNHFKLRVPLIDSIPLVKHGDFCLAHLECSDLIERILDSNGVRQVFLSRNIRDLLVSNLRFLSDPRRGQIPAWLIPSDNKKKLMLRYLKTSGLDYLKRIKLQAGWFDKPKVVKARFEDIMGDQGEEKQRSTLDMLARMAGFEPGQIDSRGIFYESVLGNETRTYSGERSRLGDYWSDDAEHLLRQHGGRFI